MKSFLSVCLLLSVCVSFAEAQAPSASMPAPVVAAPSALPPSPAAAAPQVSVAAPSAAPQWAQELIVTAEGIPVIGPIVSKGLLYLGILSSIFTMAVAFFLGVLNVLMGALNLSGLVDIATKVAAFRDGKIMYWLKFFSMFNAPSKPENPATLTNT